MHIYFKNKNLTNDILRSEYKKIEQIKYFAIESKLNRIFKYSLSHNIMSENFFLFLNRILPS